MAIYYVTLLIQQEDEALPDVEIHTEVEAINDAEAHQAALEKLGKERPDLDLANATAWHTQKRQ